MNKNKPWESDLDRIAHNMGQPNETKQKHTPGPWTKCYYDDSFGARIEIQSKDSCVAEIPISEDDVDESNDANARLIAAAPELLEALERCLMALASMDKPNCDSANLARQAIAKATGDAQ